MLSNIMLSEVIINYDLLNSKCKTNGAEGSTVYGFRAVRYDSRNQSIEFPDISCNREDAERLISKLKENTVPFDQISYIVEDYIAEL